MPDINRIPLYMAKSLEALNKLVENVKLDNDAKKICKSAAHLFKAAENFRIGGDEEKSYVLYMRYIFTVLHVNKLASYKHDKKFYDNMLGKNDIGKANEWSNKLSESLEKRYEMLREEAETHLKLQQKASNQSERDDLTPSKQNHVVNGDQTHLKPVISSNFSLALSRDESVKGGICCSKLYDLFHDKHVKLLLMDARSSEDYASSRIKHTSCINVPAEIIKPGMSAPKLECNLPKSSLTLWATRGTVDFIVLLDWMSSMATPPLGVEIYSLKRAIYEWDTTATLKSEPLVLSGGYDSWLNYYPTFTTNAHVQRPKANLDLSPGSVLLDFDYPDLDNAFIATPSNSPHDEVKSTVKQTTAIVNGDVAGVKFKHPSIDRTTKPQTILNSVNVPSTNSIEVNTNREPSTDGGSIFKTVSKDYVKPSFDRGAKPKVGSFDWSQEDEDGDGDGGILELVSRDRQLTDAGLQLEKDRLAHEREIATLRLQREMAAEEGMRLELQKQEAILYEKIDRLEEEHRNMGADRDSVHAENATLKLKLEEMTKRSGEQAATTLKEIEKIKRHEQERLKLEKEVNRLRLERKLKEVKDVAPSHRNGEDTRPSPSVPNVVSFGSPKSSARAPDIGFERLNDETVRSRRESYANRGLSRSQSFPNLAQALEKEVAFSPASSSCEVSGGANSTADSNISVMSDFSAPLVNRSVKPSAAELTAASNRNLMPVFGGQGRALTGLRNMGNTCYMNSVIQCLSNTRELAVYFLNRQYKSDINRHNVYGHPGILVEEFAAVVQALYAGQYRSVTPRDLKKVVSRYQKLFEGSEQQDAQELLTFMMDYLHEDLNRADKSKAKELHKEMKLLEDSSLPIEKIGQKYWDFESRLNDSILVNLFQGQFKSTVSCCYCRKESVKFDTFSCISLPIPTGRNHCNLRDCLQLFRKEEKMTGSSKWKCPRCKELREAIKKIDIYRLPHILLIHLKRFFYEGVWRKKLETNVDFPLTNLDVRDYVVGSKDRSLYDLYAVTNHYGTLDGGHYTASCKNIFYNKWFKFDDHEVNEISASNVQSPAAYILYYTSQNSGIGNRHNSNL